ncbi:Wzz/FepE/Etk N-terminal domain-containing protein [Pararhodobacter sp.]|uniref:Wzz/FepE/Etk N-terminal domain-containing protein n=1 Tax=Pararhodobacter sp. TaxID=2127056 RepID=UPI002FDEB847
MGPVQTIPEILSWLRRRALLILLISVLGIAGGVLAAMKSERIYAATAVIQVINPVITGEGGAAGTTLARRIQTIEQQLMSRENLVALASRYGMFEGAGLSANDQVALLRQSISIQSIAAAHPGYSGDGSLSGLVISTRAGEPELAAAISNELADLLLQQSAASRHESAEAALRFFQQEETRLQRDIAALDDRIADFQTENEGLLPGAQILRREDLRRLEESRLSIERDIVQLRSELSTLDAASGRTVTQRRIAQLTDEIARRDDEAALITARIDTIRAELVRAPDIEREITAMDRDMTQLQAQLTSASERRREAELGLRIEDDQQSVRFVLLEAALVPEHAVSTGRRKIAMAGAMAGIILGLGLAYVLEWMHPAMRTARQMERELQLRPVISIPYTRSHAENRRRKLVWGMGTGLLLFAAILVAMALI